MARIPSNMIPLLSKAPAFELPDTVSGKPLSLKDLKGFEGTVIMFICNHCPFVIHVNPQIVSLANDYTPKGISFIAISSNDVENFPQDSPELMKKTAEENNYPFPYLYDESQEVAKSYHAACTPDFFIYNKNDELVYRGQLDDSRPGNGKPLTGKDIRNALDCLLSSTEIDSNQIPSIGCNIKWKME
jgi:thiol-disulfide isomerase/thioredoxin